MQKVPVEVGDKIQVAVDMEIHEFEVFTPTFKNGKPAFMLICTQTKKTKVLTHDYIREHLLNDHDWTMELIKLVVIVGVAVGLVKILQWCWEIL